MTNNEINGLTIGLLNLFLALGLGCLARHIKYLKPQLHNISTISYYWQIITITTFVWEICYISQFNKTLEMAQNLLIDKQHVWLKKYTWNNILPNNMASIFYAEYGAYADKEYMNNHNDWSRVVEGTHMLFCGIITFISLLLKVLKYHRCYIILISSAMGAQLMNSIMYMANYFIEMKDQNNPNYCGDWKCGKFLEDRPFMYVNLFWTIMPLYVIIELLIQFGKYNKLIWNGNLFSCYKKNDKTNINMNTTYNNINGIMNGDDTYEDINNDTNNNTHNYNNGYLPRNNMIYGFDIDDNYISNADL